MTETIMATIHFINGTNLKLKWTRREDFDTAIIITKVKNAIEKDRFIFEVDGELMIIPAQNIKYMTLNPIPQSLPKDFCIRGASMIS